MPKYGLGKRDLNLRAQLALGGMTDEPERDIATLLASSQPIEARTRMMLAAAFKGRLESASIRVGGRKKLSRYRAFRLRLERLGTGRLVKALIEERGYENAVSDIAERSGRGTSDVEACYTFLNRHDTWIASCRDDGVTYSDFELTTAFIYSDINNLAPDDAIKASLPVLSELIELLEERFDLAGN